MRLLAEVAEWAAWLVVLGYAGWAILYGPPHALAVAVAGTLALAVALAAGAWARRG